MGIWKGVLLEGEKVAAVCRKFGISRKTGFKLFNRYKDLGLEDLEDRSRCPYRHANKLPFQIEWTIVHIKRDRPGWGALNILEKLIRDYPIIKPLATLRSAPRRRSSAS